jgi:hypothetical protein
MCLGIRDQRDFIRPPAGITSNKDKDVDDHKSPHHG